MVHITICVYIPITYIRDVNRFWSSRRKLKSSRQIDADGCLLRPGVWDKWCKILHSRPLLALNFIIETSFLCTMFLIFSAIVQIKDPFLLLLIILWQWFRHFNLLTTIKISFLQCNLAWKTEQLTNYKCSLIQYGDENDSEVLLYYRLAYPYDFGVRLTIFWAILFLRPYDCCQFPYHSANLRYFRKVFGSGPSFHCGSVYYRSYRHFRLLKKLCQNVKILIINPKSI